MAPFLSLWLRTLPLGAAPSAGTHPQHSRRRCRNLSKLWAAIAPAVSAHGTLRTHGELGRVRSQQKGVVRTNCVDCLDRTNVVQALLGRRALEVLLSDLLLMEAGGDLATAFPEVRPPSKSPPPHPLNVTISPLAMSRKQAAIH